MNSGRMTKNFDLNWGQKGRTLRRLAAVVREGHPRYHATFLRNVMSRIAMALVFVAALPMLACHHGTLVQAQNDPLNNAYKPTVDCNSADYPSNVSLTNALSKLRQTADSPTSITGYGTTPLPCITIYGTQNQFVSFQVNVQAPSGGYSALTISVSAMSKSTGPGASSTIPAPSTSANDIVVYREYYTYIPSPNQSGHIWFDATGYYPDALIPAIDPYWHQTTAAFPVTVAAGQNQSAWVDVYIPEAAPSGWYSGTATVSNSGTTIATLPVLLAVWQWPASDGDHMPSTPTLHTIEGVVNGDNNLCVQAYTSASTCNSTYPGSYPQTDAPDDLAVQLLDDRLNLSVNGVVDGVASGLSTVETDLLNGTTTPRLNTILPGAKIGPEEYSQHGFTSSAQAWVSNFVSNGWFNTNQTWDYLCDEPPSGCTWANLNAWAAADRGYSTPNVPELVTTDLADATANSALNSIDWMIVHIVNMEPAGGSNQRSTYNTWLSGNCCSGSGPKRELWLYTSCDPNCGSGTTGEYPNYAIDNLPVANEALEWMSFRYDVAGELYYSLDGCFWGNNGCKTPWGPELSAGVYGDGNLLYVGTNAAHCSSCGGAFVNVSTPIWMPSIRVKLMRDGVQDYEYLYLLNSLGGQYATDVTNAINEWIQTGCNFNATATAAATVSDQAGGCQSGSTTFSGDITDAKIALGAAVHQLTYPPVLQPPTNPMATLQ